VKKSGEKVLKKRSEPEEKVLKKPAEPAGKKPEEKVLKKRSEPDEKIAKKPAEPTGKKPEEKVLKKPAEPTEKKPDEKITKKIAKPTGKKLEEQITKKSAEPTLEKPSEPEPVKQVVSKSEEWDKNKVLILEQIASSPFIDIAKASGIAAEKTWSKYKIIHEMKKSGAVTPKLVLDVLSKRIETPNIKKIKEEVSKYI
jgi:hypothetical protein